MVKHPAINKLEYNQITKYIYIGTNVCCQQHFDKKLKKENITVDISLEKERIDSPFGVEFYLWIPVADHTPLTPDQFDFGVSVLEKLVALDKRVYVHCQNGHGRAPTLVAAYLIKKGQRPSEAIAFIKSKRPTIHLDLTQLQALDKFSKK